MKKILAFLFVLLLAGQLHAQEIVQLQVAGKPVSSSNPYPISLSSSSTVNLGTTASAASPRISGDATSGFYTSGAAKVDVTISGSKTFEWGTAGATNTGTLATTGDFSVNTNKFNVTATSGNTTVAGTLGVTGDVAVNTNKFNVTASTGATNVAGILTTASGRIIAIRVVTAAGAVTVATTDNVVIVNKTIGAATAVNLPATPTTGTIFYIKDGKGDASSNNITITPAAGTIDGAATYVINSNFAAVQLIYNGTQWNII